MNPDDLLPLVDAQSAARAQIVERTSAGVQRLTAAVENWADPAQIVAYTTRVGQAVGAGQTAVAMVTNTYWYLQAVPELMAVAAQRFESCMPELNHG